MNVFSALMGLTSEVPVVRKTAFQPIKKEFKKDQNSNEVYRILSHNVLR